MGPATGKLMARIGQSSAGAGGSWGASMSGSALGTVVVVLVELSAAVVGGALEVEAGSASAVVAAGAPVSVAPGPPAVVDGGTVVVVAVVVIGAHGSGTVEPGTAVVVVVVVVDEVVEVGSHTVVVVGAAPLSP
jgi:hypothetical protein